jgi:uncharacterized protein YjbI with pentapeptide repeats
MDSVQTLGLFEKGKDAWNAWAAEMQAQRPTLLEQDSKARTDELPPDGDADRANSEGLDNASRNWLQAATADFEGDHEFKDNVDFSGLIFPADAWFSGVRFSGDASFDNAQFLGNVLFDGATFSGDASFDGAEFSGKMTLFQRVTFSGKASFDGAQFSSRDAIFDHANFSLEATFKGTKFFITTFSSATFSGHADFSGGSFGSAEFRKATFSGEAEFQGARFGRADFEDAKFSNARFTATTFSDADFSKAKFSGDAWFYLARFSGRAQFDQCTFEGSARYVHATFEDDAIFEALRSERGFSLSGASFAQVPNFIEAHFTEGPRLDNVRLRIRGGRWDPTRGWTQSFTRRSGIVGHWRRVLQRWKGVLLRRMSRRSGGWDENAPARYRALKRLAIQAHDHESEMRFFAGEIISARFVTDYPWPQPIWRLKGWAGFARFWLGLLYHLFSNFGRSLIVPILLWFTMCTFATLCFLGQTADVTLLRRATQAEGGWSQVTYVTASAAAWWNSQPCFAGQPNIAAVPAGLPEAIRRSTNAAAEATQLAFRNALLFIDGGADAAYRTFGCLYGTVGQNAVVPSRVSAISLIQKLVSFGLIFLFGLAVRNMFRIK